MKKIIVIAFFVFFLFISSCNDDKIKTEVILEGENLKGYTIDEIYAKLDSLESKYLVPAIDDKINEETWEIIQGHDGKILNKQMTIDRIISAKTGEIVYPVVDTIEAEKLESIDTIGSFKTEILSTSSERLNNIKVSAQEIDGLIIEPGKEFSFNTVLGKRTVDKGYQPAPIFISSPEGIKTELGIGGGICQVSTTIYNAANESQLKITERHRHSKNVNYVEENKDATVVYNSKDLKFVNNKEYPIMIKINIQNDKYLEVNILENKNIKF